MIDRVFLELVRDVVDDPGNSSIDAMVTQLRQRLEGDPTLHEHVYRYAARHLIMAFIRGHRRDPIPGVTPTEEVEADTPNVVGTGSPEAAGLEDGGEVIVHEPDPNFTPTPISQEERDAQRRHNRRSMFEFRLNQSGRMISIWKARREVIEAELHRRQRQIAGHLRHRDFLLALVERLGPGQNAEDAGITNEEMTAMYRNSVVDE